MSLSPWTECIKGHDLTTPDAYIYRNGGSRECRACAYDKLTDAQKKRFRGEFGSLAAIR
jgi:hypothetical protein